jgi:hypothetical protein
MEPEDEGELEDETEQEAEGESPAAGLEDDEPWDLDEDETKPPASSVETDAEASDETEMLEPELNGDEEPGEGVLPGESPDTGEAGAESEPEPEAGGEPEAGAGSEPEAGGEPEAGSGPEPAAGGGRRSPGASAPEGSTGPGQAGRREASETDRRKKAQADMLSYLEGLTRSLPEEKRREFDQSEMRLKIAGLKNKLLGRPGLREDVDRYQDGEDAGRKVPVTRRRLSDTLKYVEKISGYHPDRDLADALRARVHRILERLGKYR